MTDKKTTSRRQDRAQESKYRRKERQSERNRQRRNRMDSKGNKSEKKSEAGDRQSSRSNEIFRWLIRIAWIEKDKAPVGKGLLLPFGAKASCETHLV